MRRISLFIPVTFDGRCRDNGVRPEGLWQERAKRALLDMWECSEVAQVYRHDLPDVMLYDYFIRPNAHSIGPDISHAQVLYLVDGELTDDDIMLLMMKHNAFQDAPDLPFFK